MALQSDQVWHFSLRLAACCCCCCCLQAFGCVLVSGVTNKREKASRRIYIKVGLFWSGVNAVLSCKKKKKKPAADWKLDRSWPSDELSSFRQCCVLVSRSVGPATPTEEVIRRAEEEDSLCEKQRTTKGRGVFPPVVTFRLSMAFRLFGVAVNWPWRPIESIDNDAEGIKHDSHIKFSIYLSWSVPISVIVLVCNQTFPRISNLSVRFQCRQTWFVLGRFSGVCGAGQSVLIQMTSCWSDK